MLRKLRPFIYLLIPLASVLICRGLRLAQGERTEEIAFGVMLGLFIDAIVALISYIAGRK